MLWVHGAWAWRWEGHVTLGAPATERFRRLSGDVLLVDLRTVKSG